MLARLGLFYLLLLLAAQPEGGLRGLSRDAPPVAFQPGDTFTVDQLEILRDYLPPPPIPPTRTASSGPGASPSPATAGTCAAPS